MKLPTYDPLKDRILGCTKGSIFYKHEQGHQHLFRIGIESQIQSIMFMFLVLAVVFVSFKDYFYGSICSVVTLILYIIPEIHAWWYAFKR